MPITLGRGGGPWPITAGGQGAPRAGEPAHETLHGEKRRGSRRHAARAVSVPRWGRGGMHSVHGRAENIEGKRLERKGKRCIAERAGQSEMYTCRWQVAAVY